MHMLLCVYKGAKNMEHPLIGNISDLSINQLQEKITELTKKLSFVYNSGNANLTAQVRMALETYTNKYYEKLNELAEKESKVDFSKKINIS